LAACRERWRYAKYAMRLVPRGPDTANLKRFVVAMPETGTSRFNIWRGVHPDTYVRKAGWLAFFFGGAWVKRVYGV
jgi:hypothetical protein